MFGSVRVSGPGTVWNFFEYVATTIDIGKTDGLRQPFDLPHKGSGQIMQPTQRPRPASPSNSQAYRSDKNRTPLAIYQPASPKNGEIGLPSQSRRRKVRSRWRACPATEQPAGLLSCPGGCTEGQGSFFRTNDGASEEMAGVDADVSSQSWHELKIRVVNDQFTVSLDGTSVFTAFDKTLSLPGRIALWTGGQRHPICPDRDRAVAMKFQKNQPFAAVTLRGRQHEEISMTITTERRKFIGERDRAAAVTTATPAGSPASADPPTEQRQSDAVSTRPLSLDPKSIKGISEKVLMRHYENNTCAPIRWDEAGRFYEQYGRES